MSRCRSLIRVLTAVALLSVSRTTQAAASPLAMIQATTQKTLAALQNPAYQGDSHRQERLTHVAAAILPHFDATGLAQRALGPEWHQLSVDQQQEFVRLMMALVQQNYAATIDRYGRDVQISYAPEHIDGAYAEVDTQVSSPSLAQSLPVNYFLHQVNGQWLIYDVEIDNVSMDLNYRHQFARILRSASYADLVQRLKSKLRELGMMPS